MISVKKRTNKPGQNEIEEFCKNLKKSTESNKVSQKLEILTEKSREKFKIPKKFEEKESRVQKEQQVQMVQQAGEGENNETLTVILETSTEKSLKRKNQDRLMKKECDTYQGLFPKTKRK